MTTSEFTIGEWEVEHFRATTFHLADDGILERTQLWQDVVGSGPISIDSRPQERVMRQIGDLGGRQLLLLVRVDRVDWFLQPSAEVPTHQAPVIPTLGDASEALSSFRNVVDRWLDQSPLVTRMAFGSVMMSQIDDLRSGFAELSKYLPKLGLDPPDGTDFFYQINRPRTSQSLDGIKLNRLTKWSTMQIGMVSIAIGSSAPPVTQIAPTQFNLARRLELDINTAPEQTIEASTTKAQSVFSELVMLGCELANQGDVP